MLVSTALIVIVMLMFAQVYQVAASSVGTQKGIVENDQRSRTLTTVIKNDLASRTFRLVTPYLAGDTTYNEREGYVYYSENNPLNDSDDVLQFTIRLGTNDEPLTGRASLLGATPDLRQPEGDDGQIILNGANRNLETNSTGASRIAEVSYFLRRGNLYRCILLLREPYDPGGALVGVPDGEYQPQDSAGPPANPLIVSPYAGNFWESFYYSAHYFDPGGGGYPVFHGPTCLKNDGTATFPLAHPFYRFGHDYDNPANPTPGTPREYATGGEFIGRFTHEETSHSNFGYPGFVPVAGSPMAPGTTATYDSATGVVTEFAGGSSRGDDLLMSNVHAFDVKLWDREYDEDANGNDTLDAGEDLNRNGILDTPPAGAPPRSAGAFADVGHNAFDGSFKQIAAPDRNRHLNAAPQIVYGPRDAVSIAENRVFDTWHPLLDFDDLDGGLPGGEDPPPFRPIVPTVWAPATAYNVGDIVEPLTPNGYFYRCIGAGTSDPVNEPGFPPSPRLTFTDGSPGTEVTWRPEAHVPAIQITIRFLDTASGQMRQLTLVESLVD